MDRKTLAVVITYKAPERLAACLAALNGQCYYRVIDNTNDNLLYTKAVNVGLREAAAYEYVYVCCDDVLTGPDCIRDLVSFMETHPKCALASPLQHFGEQVTCGGVVDCWPAGRHITAPLDHPHYSEPKQQPWANGAAFLLRLSAAREFGLMDENMRFICSDADYGLTARARGWECWLVPHARVSHKPNLAANPTPEIAEVCAADQQYFFKKWVMSGLFREFAVEGRKVPEGLLQHYAKQLQEALSRP